MTIKHLTSTSDLTIEETHHILKLAHSILESPSNFSDSCKGKVLGTLFLNPPPAPV